MFFIGRMIILAGVVLLLSRATGHSFSMTSTDARTQNYLKQETAAWETFPKNNLTDSMRIIFDLHSFNLNFNYGLLDSVIPYSDALAQNVSELNRTANRAFEVLKGRSNSEIQDFADITIRDVPQKISAIFDEVKTFEFKKYLADVNIYFCFLISL